MTDASAPTPEAVKEWASDWADQYDQTITTSDLSVFVGKKVQGTGTDSNGNPRHFEADIIGFGRDVLTFALEDDGEFQVFRPTLISLEGLQLPVFSGMVLETVEEE